MFREGEVMRPNNEGSLNEDFFLSPKIEKVSKEELLADNFQKAKSIKEKDSNKKKITKKKSFFKF